MEKARKRSTTDLKRDKKPDDFSQSQQNQDKWQIYPPSILHDVIRAWNSLIETVVNSIQEFAKEKETASESTSDGDYIKRCSALGPLFKEISRKHQILSRACQEREIDPSPLDRFLRRFLAMEKEYSPPFDADECLNEYLPEDFLEETLSPTVSVLLHKIHHELDSLPAHNAAVATRSILGQLHRHHGLPIQHLPGQLRKLEYLSHVFGQKLLDWGSKTIGSTSPDWRTLSKEEIKDLPSIIAREFEKGFDDPMQAQIRLSEKGSKSFEWLNQPLNGSFKDVADFIIQNPGKTAKQIAKAVCLSESTIRNRILPKLRMLGFHRRGQGYYPPVEIK